MKAVVTAVVEVFYGYVLADPLLREFFVGVDLAALKGKQVELFLSLAGEGTYTGRDMRTAHAALRIEPRHFARVARYLEQALRECDVPSELRVSLLAKACRMVGAIATAPDRIEMFQAAVEPHRKRIVEHPLYARITTIEAVRTFMQHHVFAVWDFMSLLKSLQGAVTCVRTPWVPVGDPSTRRFVNEIVLGEESDCIDGAHISHYEMYLTAMLEAGAEVESVTRFTHTVSGGHLVQVALEDARVPAAAHRFVLQTMDTIAVGHPWAIAAVFTAGREELIPAMFLQVIRGLEGFGLPVKKLLAYLDRHVVVDGEEHGPLALRLLENLCGNDASRWDEATGAAINALRARAALWDAVLAEIDHAAQ